MVFYVKNGDQPWDRCIKPNQYPQVTQSVIFTVETGVMMFLVGVLQVHPRLPASLVRASEVLVIEAPPGVKANVLRFLRGIPKERISKRPVEKSR